MNSVDDLLHRAIEVKRRHERELLSKPNVVGVGVGFMSRGGQPTDEVGLIVSVSHKVPAEALRPEDLIPDNLDGVPVAVVASGTLHAQ